MSTPDKDKQRNQKDPQADKPGQNIKPDPKKDPNYDPKKDSSLNPKDSKKQ